MQASAASPFKFKSLSSWPAWLVSSALHLSPLLLMLVSFLFEGRPTENVSFEVFEMPSVAPHALPPTPLAPPPIKKAPVTPRAVFGASRNSITADDGATVKAGNTVAKTPDDQKLRDDDADHLPIPTEEFLVSQMPVLIGEIRAAYPEEAKKKKIEGPVLFDLLIDGAGIVREAVLLEGPGSGLNEAALTAVKQFRFKPAQVEDKPVAVRIRYAYRFVLER